MSDPDTREKVSTKRKKNIMAKALRSSENKGAFAIKVIDSKTQAYKREKLRVKNILELEEDEEQI